MSESIRPRHFTERGQPLDTETLNRITDHVLQRIRGPSVALRRVGTGLGMDVETPRAGGLETAWWEITAVAVAATNRWKYTAKEVQPLVGGTFRDHPSGRTTDVLYNSVESNNSASGVQGNGVNISGTSYPSGFSPAAIGIGAVVLAYKVQSYAPTGSDRDIPIWLCCVTHADDGTCT